MLPLGLIPRSNQRYFFLIKNLQSGIAFNDLLCLSQKNPQIMYLEQELESLKAVLEIKNEKLHQQDVKLMKMEKLVRFCQRLPKGPGVWGAGTGL